MTDDQAATDEIPRASEAEALASLREFALGPISAVFTWSEAATVLDLIEMLTKGGIIEVAIRNPNVAEYMAHWEGRAEKAEARWLLEDIKSPVSGPMYFTLDPQIEGDWTRDHHKALGFSRKIDAEQFRDSYVFDIDDEQVVRICEHGFGSALANVPPQVNEAVAWWKGTDEEFQLLYAATPEQIATSLQSQRDKLTTLPENWDGYGAHPLTAEIVDAMLSEITVEGGVVDLVPGADGSIQAEWHRRGDIDVEYAIYADGKRSLYVNVTPLASPSPGTATAGASDPLGMKAAENSVPHPVSGAPTWPDVSTAGRAERLETAWHSCAEGEVPAAITLMVSRFDHELGEWIVGVAESYLIGKEPASVPKWTHWRYLGAMPDQALGDRS